MSKALDTLTEKYNAQVVGGIVIAVLDGVHTELGIVNHDELVLNDVGQKLLKVAPLDHDGDTNKGGGPAPRKKRGQAAAEPEPTPVVEPEPTPVVEEPPAPDAEG